MIFFYGFLLTMGILAVIALSIPVKVRLESGLVFLIQWIFLSFRIVIEQKSIRTELLLFNKRIEKRKKAEGQPITRKEKPEKKKPRKKIPFSFIRQTLQDAAVKKVIYQSLQLVLRCFSAVRVRLLKWNFGLKDYYWQGIATGIVSGLPYTKRLQVRGNFEEINDFLLVLQISIWRVLSAIVIFLCFFPYYRVVRIYFRFRAATVLDKQ
ncbi:hypothetical protein KKI24_05645 [bacterium]|nr:hypothetical protein [bacterium]